MARFRTCTHVPVLRVARPTFRLVANDRARFSLFFSPDPVSRASAAAKIRSAYRCNEPRVKIATEKNSENSSPSSVPKII